MESFVIRILIASLVMAATWAIVTGRVIHRIEDYDMPTNVFVAECRKGCLLKVCTPENPVSMAIQLPSFLFRSFCTDPSTSSPSTTAPTSRTASCAGTTARCCTENGSGSWLQSWCAPTMFVWVADLAVPSINHRRDSNQVFQLILSSLSCLWFLQFAGCKFACHYLQYLLAMPMHQADFFQWTDALWFFADCEGDMETATTARRAGFRL